MTRKLLILWVRHADVEQKLTEGWQRCAGPVVNPWAVMMWKDATRGESSATAMGGG